MGSECHTQDSPCVMGRHAQDVSFKDIFFFASVLSDLFIYVCPGSSQLLAGILQLQPEGATFHCGAPVSHCVGFSCCRAQALGTQASVVAVCKLSQLPQVRVLIAQSCLTLCNPVDCRPLGSSGHGIILARILEWVAISFSRGSS